jgi:hypothetical protein
LTDSCHAITIHLTIEIFQGASSPGWEGTKAKPVQVRRCPATVRL